MSLNRYNDTPLLRSSRNPYSSAHFLPGLKSTKRQTILPSSGQKVSGPKQSHNEFTPATSNESPYGIPSKRLLGSVWATVRNLDLLSITPAAETSKDALHTTNRSLHALKPSLIQHENTHNSTCAVQGISRADVAGPSEQEPAVIFKNISNIKEASSSIASCPRDTLPQQQDPTKHVQGIPPRPGSRPQTRAASSLSNTASLVSTAGYNADTEVRYSSTCSRISEESFGEHRQYINKSTTSRAVQGNPPKDPPGSVLSINSLYHEFVRDLADPVAEVDGSSQSTPRTLAEDLNSVTWGGSSLIKHDLITVPEFTINPSDLQLPTRADYLKEQDKLPSFSARVRAYQAKGDAAYEAVPEPTFTEDWIFHLDDKVHTYKQYVPFDFTILEGGRSFSPHDGQNLQCRPPTPPSTPDSVPNIDTSPGLHPSAEQDAFLLRRISSGLSQATSSSISFVNQDDQPSASIAIAKQSLPILTISPPKSPELPDIPRANADITTKEQHRSKRRRTYSLSSIPELAILSLAYCTLSEEPEVEPPYAEESNTEDLSTLTGICQQQLPAIPIDQTESIESLQIKGVQLQATSPSSVQLASNQEEQIIQANLSAAQDLEIKASIFPELDLASSLNLDVNLSLAEFIPQRSPSAPPQLNSPTLRHTKWTRITTPEPQQAAPPSQRNSIKPPTLPIENTPIDTSPTTPTSEDVSTLSLPTHLKALLHESCPFPAPIQRSRLIPRHISAAPWLKTRSSSADLKQSSEVAEVTPCQSQNQVKDQVQNQVEPQTKTHSKTGTVIKKSKSSEKTIVEAVPCSTTATTASLDPLTGNTSTTHSWTEVWAGQGDLYKHLAPDSEDKRDRDRDRGRGGTSTGWKGRQRQRVKGMLRGVLRRA